MIWLIGNKGMLGRDVERLFIKQGVFFSGSDVELDITNSEKLQKYASMKSIKWIINCAAYTDVEKAEEEYEKAFTINADAVLNIAHLAREIGAKLIHISTDYVFDGKKKEAYTESDIPNPQNVYGKSKLNGEKNIENTILEYFILRTAWLYGFFGDNFVHTMLKLFNKRDVVRVVSDQWGSPTYTMDLAQGILAIIESGSSEYGIYHTTNEGKTSWYKFAQAIYRSGLSHGLINKEVEILPMPSADYKTNATRPKNSYLSKTKYKSTFKSSLPNWQNGLESFLTEIVNIQGASS